MNLINISYKTQLLFRLKSLKKQLKLIKGKSNLTFLRSPKHFNIGKQKIINVNYKILQLDKSTYINLHLKNFLSNGKLLFKLLQSPGLKNTILQTKSIKVLVVTKFIIKWLEF